MDVQNDFCPGGNLAVPNGDTIVGRINQTMTYFDVVIASKDWHPKDHCSFERCGGKWPEHCVAGTFGAEFHPDLDVTRITHVIHKAYKKDKDSYSAFDGTGLVEMLRALGIKDVYVCGLATDYCVLATALDAQIAGFRTIWVRNASAGVTKETCNTAIAKMQSTGIFHQDIAGPA